MYKEERFFYQPSSPKEISDVTLLFYVNFRNAKRVKLMTAHKLFRYQERRYQFSTKQ